MPVTHAVHMFCSVVQVEPQWPVPPVPDRAEDSAGCDPGTIQGKEIWILRNDD